MKNRTKPSSYPTVPFVAVRAISLISSIIVASILAFFCRQLWADKYKIPWTFIVVLLAALVNIIFILFTSIISCCATLSPLLNIFLNIPLLFLWVFSISLLTWNMYGALGHTCSLDNWGNDRGVMVCQIYKTLYSFVVFANLAHIAQLVLDVRARHTQIRRGKYDKMRDINGSQDIRIDDLKPLAPHTVHDQPMASETSLQTFRDDNSSHYQQEFRDETPGWRPGQQTRPTPSQTPSYASSTDGYGRRNDHYHSDGDLGSVQMQDFTSYHRPQQTHYESGGYSSGYGYGSQQQAHYYQGRY